MKAKNHKERVGKNTGPWTPSEHSRFEIARKTCKRWKDVANFIGTRSSSQCRSHHQKMELQKKRGKKFRVTCVEMLEKASQVNDFDIVSETGFNPLQYVAFFSMF